MDNWVFSGSQCCGMIRSWSFPAQCFLWICASPPDFNLPPPLHSPLSLPDVSKREGWTEGMWKIFKSSNHLFVFHQWWARNLFLKPWKQNKTKRLFPEKLPLKSWSRKNWKKTPHKPGEGRSNFNPLKSPQISQLEVVSDQKICMYFCLSCPSVCLSPLSVCFLLSCGDSSPPLPPPFWARGPEVELRVASMRNNLILTLRRKWVRRHHYSA